VVEGWREYWLETPKPLYLVNAAATIAWFNNSVTGLNRVIYKSVITAFEMQKAYRWNFRSTAPVASTDLFFLDEAQRTCQNAVTLLVPGQY